MLPRTTVLALLLAIASPALAQDTRPLAVGEGHGFDPGAKRRAPAPVDELASPAAPAVPIEPALIAHGPRDARRVALTFDACPSTVENGGFRRDIIEWLRAERVPATLFLSSRWAKWRPEVVAELAAEPLFELESHGSAHVDMRRYTPAKMATELARSQAVLHQVTGRVPRYFRPPRGDWDPELLEQAGKLGLTTLTFDVISADAEATFQAPRIVRNVLDAVQPGSIVVFHFNGPAKHTLEALPEVVRSLREQGYELVTVEQLLGERPLLASVAPGEPAPFTPFAPEVVEVSTLAPAPHEEVAAAQAAAAELAASQAAAAAELAASQAAAAELAAAEAAAAELAASQAAAAAELAASQAAAAELAAAEAAAARVAVARGPAAPPPVTAAATSQPPGVVRHRLASGERIVDLALRFGSTIDAIVTANAIRDVRRLQIGQELAIPVVVVEAPRPAPLPPLPPGSIRYVIRPGDKLDDIARAHRSTVPAIMEANGIREVRRLQIGAALILPLAGRTGASGEASN